MSETAASLYLVTPRLGSAAAFVPTLEAALSAVPVACVLLRADPGDAAGLKRLVAIVQAQGAAALVEGDAALATAVAADGVHLDGGSGLQATLTRMKPDRIVGVGGLTSRDDAMTAGDSAVDYIMLGDQRPGEPPLAFDERLERAAWWAEIFQVPCVACADALDEIEPLAACGAEFVAVGAAVWDDPRGPETALRDAMAACEAGSATFAARQAERV